MKKGRFRKNRSSFQLEEFLAPPKEYSLITSWAWNAPVTEEETDK
jgi:hypothetical protein